MDRDDAHAAQLFELITAAWTTRALAVAAELRIAEALREPQHPAALAAAIDCDTANLQRLLRALSAIGVCTESDDGLFAITPLGALLTENHPRSLRAWSLQFGHQLWPAWGELDTSLRTGKGLRERAGEAHGFSHLQHDAEAAAVFNRAMVEITRIVAADAVRKVDLGAARHLVDVGGGHGQLLAEFLKHWPEPRGTVLDLPHAHAGAKRQFEAQGLGDRADFLAGDFFITVPPADVLLMKSILHDWQDERCAKILVNCRRALDCTGRLLVIDRVLPERFRDDPRHRALARSDLTMMVGIGGRERTEAQFRRLFDCSGFVIDSLRPLVLDLSLIDCRPA